MRRLLIIATLWAGCSMAASAQASFTQRLQQSNTGEGRVTVTQDKAITDLVDGPKDVRPATPTQQTTPQKPVTPAPKPLTQNAEEKQQETAPKPQTEEKRPQLAERQESTPDTTVTVPEEARKKVMKGGYKVNGYRVQVYAGGNSRDARQQAERIGREINSLFPGEPVYVHFYSPRWICRMGNYRTYEEAHQTLNAVKKLGYKSAIIVKGKITVQYLPSKDNP